MSALDYAAWSRLLFDELFKPEHARQPVFLFVDDGVIARLAGTDDASSAVESLSWAVRLRLGSVDRDQVFSSITNEGAEWFVRPTRGAPPCLPFLALCVLAGSHMADQGSVAATNYYVPLRELLGLPGRGMVPGFEWASPTLWRGLARWMDQTMHGDLGLSTIREHPTLRYVGYPLSQTIFRASDREAVATFLLESKPSPATRADPARLLDAFRAWSRGRPGVSAGFRRAMQARSMGGLLADILDQTVRSWDGSAPQRRTMLPIHVVCASDKLGKVSYRLVAPRRDGAPASLEVHGHGHGHHALEAPGDWYAVPVPVDGQLLGEGLVLQAPAGSLRLAPRALYLFVQDPTVGGWINVDAAAGETPHRILARSYVAEELEEYLGVAAKDGWRARDSRIAGWALIEDVVLRPGRPAPDDPRLRALAPAAGDVVDLVGGLRLAGRQGYLTGGAPDLVVKPGASAQPVFVDGRFVGQAEPDDPFLLRGLVDVGEHRIDVGGATLHLTVGEAGTATGEPGCPGASAWRLGADGTLMGAVLDRGMDHPGTNVAPPVVLRRPAQYVLLGATPGEVLDVPTAYTPAWVARLDLNRAVLEVWPPFEVVWSIRRGRYRRDVTLLRPIEPSASDPSSDAGSWARWLMRVRPTGLDDDARGLWDRYRTVAAGVLADG